MDEVLQGMRRISKYPLMVDNSITAVDGRGILQECMSPACLR